VQQSYVFRLPHSFLRKIIARQAVDVLLSERIELKGFIGTLEERIGPGGAKSLWTNVVSLAGYEDCHR